MAVAVRAEPVKAMALAVRAVAEPGADEGAVWAAALAQASVLALGLASAVERPLRPVGLAILPQSVIPVSVLGVRTWLLVP